MLCAACRHQADQDFASCPVCGSPGLVDDQYRLDAIVNDLGHTASFGATRVSDGIRVILQQVIFRVPDLNENIPRVQRYGAYLTSLDHPSIPVALDTFQTRDRDTQSLWFAHAVVPGDTLETVLARHQFSEAEVVRLLFEIAEVLRYLHSRSPPVIHRAIQPRHLVRTDGGGPLVLLEFGLPPGTGSPSRPPPDGVLVSGAPGFMAPEQLRGQALPATDIFCAGVTALHLLSRTDPRQLFDYSQRLDKSALSALSRPMVRLLEQMVQANPAYRLPDGNALRQALDRSFLAGGTPRIGAPTPTPIASTAVERWASVNGNAEEAMARARIEWEDLKRWTQNAQQAVLEWPEWARGALIFGALGISVFFVVGILTLVAEVEWPTLPQSDARTCYVEANQLYDPGLEYVVDQGVPRRDGAWVGYRVRIVDRFDDMAPLEGRAMMSFGAPAPSDAEYEGRAHQLVNIDAARDRIAKGEASLVACAHFNGVPQDGKRSRFSITVRGYNGPMSAFPDLYRQHKHIRGPYRQSILTDKDPQTWQRVCIDVQWQQAVDFVQIEVTADRELGDGGGRFMDHACLAFLDP